MDKDTLPEYPGLIKDPKDPPLSTEEQLTHTLYRAETLAELIVKQDLATYPLSDLDNCHLMLLDLIQKAVQLHETLLPVSQMTLFQPPKETPD